MATRDLQDERFRALYKHNGCRIYDGFERTRTTIETLYLN